MCSSDLEAGGLPILYLLKAEILFFAVAMALQGLSLTIRSAFVLAGRPLPKPAA